MYRPNPSSTSSSSVSSLHNTSWNDSQALEPYPRLVIRMEGIPYQSQYEELYGQKMFEYTIPLPEAIFNLNPPLFTQSPRSFQRVYTSRIPAVDMEEPPESAEDWRNVARSLHEWLCANQEQKDLDEWKWVVNLFWIANVACNPAFPKCPYDQAVEWNSDIVPLLCEHISQKSEGLDRDLTIPAQELAWLLWQDWLKLRRYWLCRGVFAIEYTSRIGRYYSESVLMCKCHTR